MKTSTFVSAIAVAVLVSSGLAQQSTPKSTWLKPTAPRVPIPHVGGGGGGPATPMPVTSALVGGADNCASPDVLSGVGAFFFNNTTATTGLEGQAESACNLYANTAILNDVWFTWTATFTGSARITTCGIGNSVDTKIAVYAGSACPTGPALSCNDDACASFESTVDVTVTSGQPYVIQLGLYPNGGATPGTGQISINQLFAPTEDSCSTPIVIGGTGNFAFDNTAATTGSQGQTEAACNFFANTAILNDVWYTWTAPFSGNARLDTCGVGSGIDTKIAVYAGAGCPIAAAIACDDDACPSFESTVVFSVASGQQYTIQIGLYPGGGSVGGAGTFSIQQFFGLPNDECTGALSIVGAGPHGYDTTNASTSPVGQTNARCFIFNASAITSDLWYVWTASSTGWVALNTCLGGAHDLKVAVYAGGGCPTMEPLSCDDDACGTLGGMSRAVFFATSGQQYLFQIGSYTGQPGAAGFFTVDPYTLPPGDDCSAPIVLAGSGPYMWDTTLATTGFEGQTEVLCANELVTYDLWHTWTSNCTGSVTVSLCNLTASDTKLAVYSGAGCPTASALVCNDDGCGVGGGPSIVTFNAVLGQSYTIQLGHWPGDVSGVGMFSIQTSCPPVVGTAFCAGDGSATACPCGNFGAAGNGCASNVSAAGANLSAVGVASISSDTVVLMGSGMPNSSALYFQGTSQQSGGLGVTFGDGLRCAGGSILRLKTLSNMAGASHYPGPGDLSLSVRGGVVAVGSRTYQVWYRNAAAFCTVSTFNLSNGLQLDWQP